MGCHDELHVGEHADQLGKDLELVDGVKMQVDLVDDDHAAYVGGSGERGGAGRFEVAQDRQDRLSSDVSPLESCVRLGTISPSSRGAR